MTVYKTYIAQVAQNTQPQPNSGVPTQGIDPWILVGAGLGSAITAIGAFLLKVSDSSIVSKTMERRNSKVQAETNAVLAEKLTSNNIEAQEAETFMDLSNTVADIARKGVDNSTDYNRELLSIVRESISASQLNAESRNCLVKATENLVESQKGTIEATRNIVNGMDKLAQAQEVARKEILESHEMAVSEFKVTCDRMTKQMFRTENTVKDQFGAAIAQLRIDIKESEKRVIEAIKAS
jgi:hypothetical protein